MLKIKEKVILITPTKTITLHLTDKELNKLRKEKPWMLLI